MLIKFYNKFYLEFSEHDDNTIWSGGTYEQAETNLFAKFVKSNDIVFDIGAHVGYFTVLFSTLGAKVFAFEPSPINFGLLQKNLIRNNIKNVQTKQIAISDKNEYLHLYHCPFNYGMNRAYPSIVCNNNHYIKVEACTIDSLGLPTPDWIKIDVEGYELRVLYGMMNLLQSNADIKMLIEFSPIIIKECGYSAIEILTFLSTYNFALFYYNLDEDKWQSFPTEHIKLSIQQIDIQWKIFYPSLHGLSKEQVAIKVQQFLIACGYDRPINENLLAIRQTSSFIASL